MMELPGQRICISNDTDDKINDLCFYIPGTDIEYKCKKLHPHTHNNEHIYDGYKGDLVFYFKNDKAKTYLFKDAVSGENLANTKTYIMGFHIIKDEHGEFDITYVGYLNDNDRYILL